MKYNPRGQTAFLMTQAEKSVLEMFRNGKNIKQIANERGGSMKNSYHLLQVAAMKEQALANDKRPPTGHTRLGVARGQKRMKR